MPSIKENWEYWDGGYDWDRGGEEWSHDWGGAAMQWHGMFMPRLYPFLPGEGGTILEIGCGHGRWTHFLKEHCSWLIAVNLSAKCIAACRHRFADALHMSFHVNDGTSLDMVEDGSIDFIFSFDTFPLLDVGAVDAYLAQFPRVLKSRGVAFLHHSNLGSYKFHGKLRRVRLMGTALRYLGIVEKELYWRDESLSVDLRDLEIIKIHTLLVFLAVVSVVIPVT